MSFDHRVAGIVVLGKRRGRLLGFPTANLSVERSLALPPDGVYAGWVWGVQPSQAPAPAAISVGRNLTFDEPTPTVEVHVLDFSGDLYGRCLEIQFVHRIREMSRFQDTQTLISAIQSDIFVTREVLSEAGQPTT
jgi:riboflavin kinase/FMN adenylyltransferase